MIGATLLSDEITLAASHAAPWWVTLSMRGARSIKPTEVYTDGRRSP